MTHKIKKYGWVPDFPDHRDQIYLPRVTAPSVYPPKIDFRNLCPPVYDQGALGSCTANAIGFVFEMMLRRQQKPDFIPSRLFIYYNERAMENTIQWDAGAQIRDGIKSINKQGVCPETEWVYDISKFAIRPNDQCYTDALQHTSIKYWRLPHTLDIMKQCLTHNQPFVVGFTVFSSFESSEVTRTGIVPMPQPNEQILGGHAVAVVGYDDSIQRFICRNSWGPNWGMNGYFTMPYEYLTNPNLSDDFWTIYIVN